MTKEVCCCLVVTADVYSTTKETHQSFLGAIMEIRIKKWKYINTIFRSNQFCIISLNNVRVLFKYVHAIRQCLDKGSFSKMTSFSLSNECLVLVKINSLELNSSKTDMTLSCSNNCLITRSNEKHVTPHDVLGNPIPILNGEQPEAFQDSEVALNDPGCIARAHPTTALSYWDPGLLDLRGLFWLLHTLDCLVREVHTGYWTKWTD